MLSKTAQKQKKVFEANKLRHELKHKNNLNRLQKVNWP